MKRHLLFLFLSSLSAPLVLQGAPAELRLDPDPLAGELALREEPLDPEVFTRAAFIFSGVPEQQLAGAQRQMSARVEQLRLELDGISDPGEQAQAALEFMHEKLLRSYDERQTSVDVLLDRGSYNCVSSAVVYAILLKSVNLPVWGVRTSDHTFCRVRAGQKAFDVETTSPFGFDPGTRKEFFDDFGRITGFSYVPPSSYGDRRDIGDRELLALILFNRTAFATERRDYPGAVAPALDAYALLDDRESYERLITSLLNLASWHGMNGHFGDALEFLVRADERFGDPRLAALRSDLVHNWVLSLIGKRGYAEAQQLLDEQVAGAGLAREEWRELTVYLYQVRARESAPGDYGEAARLILEGLAKVGADRGLSESYEVYVHNAVVNLVRSRRYEEALSMLEEALLELPASSVFGKDRSMVLEAAGRQ